MYKRVLLKLSGEALRDDKHLLTLDVNHVEGLTNVMKQLHDNGVEVAVMQLLGKGSRIARLVKVKTLYLGIIGAAALEHGRGAFLVADGGYSDVAALQVVDGQDIVIILDDGDAPCRELTFKHIGLSRIHLVGKIGGAHVLTVGNA